MGDSPSVADDEPASPNPEADHRARARASWRRITMDASSTSSSRVARAANAYRAPAAAALTRPGGSSAFAAAAVLGGNHRIVGVVAPSTCFAAAARAHPRLSPRLPRTRVRGLMSRMYAVAMGSRQAAAGGAAGIIGAHGVGAARPDQAPVPGAGDGGRGHVRDRVHRRRPGVPQDLPRGGYPGLLEGQRRQRYPASPPTQPRSSSNGVYKKDARRRTATRA